ncbi:hypothetical protein KY346_01190 [Candidatus Woesearchaeota archaeon]|nr:hypothetical protein [Candidatus Woesearchaeota archaeon]
MLEHDISDLDEETQKFLKKNPRAMLAYQIMGPPAPEPLFKSEEEYEAFARDLYEKLEQKDKELCRAAASSRARAKYKILD